MDSISSTISNLLFRYFRIDAHYFFSGGVWLTIIQAITVSGALIVSVILANVLDESQYGSYRYILGLGILFSTFSLTGIGQSIFQTAAKKYLWFYERGIRASLIYSLGISISGLTGTVYYFIQDNHELALGCLLIALFQPFVNTFQLIFSSLQGERKFRESTFLQGVKTVFITATTVGTIYITQDVFWLVFSFLVSNTVINLGIHILYKPRDTSEFDEKIYSRYMTYAKNTSIRNILGNVAFRIDSIIVFQQLGATNLAIYTIATILPEQIKTSFKNITTLLVPKYALHDNMDNIKKSMFRRSMQLLLLTILVTILYIIFAPLIYTLLFPKYHEAIVLTQLISLSFPAMIALIPLSALQAHTEEKKLNKLNTYTSVLMIMLTTVLTITHGLMGAIFAKILSRYINVAFTYFYLWQK
jgi:O-antigen/teichoic acid export membrane protein